MAFSTELTQRLAPLHLLNHPFYQAWTAGKLDQAVLQKYANDYYPHVNAFPQYVSATHALCGSKKGRQYLLENLIEEERGEENHPELWLRFAEGLGADREAVMTGPHSNESKALVDTFFSACRSSYAEGLGALYAYEHQIPEIADVKIDGLKKFYGIRDERTLQFFAVHKDADVWHRNQAAVLIDELSPEEQEKAYAAAKKVGEALWAFLSSFPCETMAA